jgi:hypothetical protein
MLDGCLIRGRYDPGSGREENDGWQAGTVQGIAFSSFQDSGSRFEH